MNGKLCAISCASGRESFENFESKRQGAMSLTIKEILKATGGRLQQGSAALRVQKVRINSRLVRPGDVFVAIIGKRLDGHRFVKEALARGARAVIVSRKNMQCTPGVAVVVVRDTTRALGEMARAHRLKFSIPVIAITGSAGKTTTKEMIAAVLQTRYRVLKNDGTENNQIGVPVTLLRLRPAHQIAVLEVGTNQPGDIRWLTHVVSPDAAVLTNIGESHLEKLKTPAGVFREKFELVKGLRKPGKVIFNADDVFLRKIPQKTKKLNMISYALRSSARYRAGDMTINARGQMGFVVNQREALRLKAASPVSIYNALAAVACGRLFQIKWVDIRRALQRFENPPGRQVIRRFHGCQLIDDTYNANPVSVRSALQTLCAMPGRRIAVCADMLELGPRSQRLHEEVGAFTAGLPLDMFFTYGRWAQYIGKAAARENKRLVVEHCSSLGVLCQRLAKACRRGDAILVKGSRGMKMERVVTFLRQHNMNKG